MTSFHTTSHPQLLVVEDDEKLATLLCRALRDDGLSAEAAFDGRTALHRLSTEPFAVVLLDVGLPGLSGLDVCARLRATGSTMPVIMLSARDGVDDVLAGRRAGASDYLLKPFSLRDLTQRLDELVGTDPSPPAHGRRLASCRDRPHRRLIQARSRHQKSDGTTVDVALDDAFNVLSSEQDTESSSEQAAEAPPQR